MFIEVDMATTICRVQRFGFQRNLITLKFAGMFLLIIPSLQLFRFYLGKDWFEFIFFSVPFLQNMINKSLKLICYKKHKKGGIAYPACTNVQNIMNKK